MTVHRYPRRALMGDYVRTAVGLGVGLGVLTTVPPAPAIIAIFGSITLLFMVFGLRTLQRQLVQVAITSDGILAIGLITRSVPWQTLDRLTLRYYGTRRQMKEGSGGFLQLTLRGGRGSVRLESSIDGFDEIVRQAAIAAQANGVPVDPTSAGNLLDLGVDADAPARP
ncbi:MAG: hypothetical protein ACTSW2_08230 [Alphaproteobacteria bacterium]